MKKTFVIRNLSSAASGSFRLGIKPTAGLRLIIAKEWEWLYGQTPEFTHTLSREFAWGTVAAEIQSKHGIITECDVRVTKPDGSVESWMHLSEALIETRYETLDDLDVSELGVEAGEVYEWLIDQM